ncbi:hypothetical protein Tco_1084812 [Tanacetum coccineum]
MVVPSAGAKPWREKKEWRTTPCPMTRVLVMAHHSMVRAKASRLWLTTPLNSGAIPNLVPNSIFLNFFSMARAYGTTTPMLGSLPVRVELDKKSIDLESILCPSCDNVVESVDHCLVLCEESLSVWDRIFAWWGVGRVDAFTLNDMICHRGVVRMEKEARVLLEVVLLVAAYYIWKSRNLRVFKAKNESGSKVFQDIQIKMITWINRRSKKHKFPWEKGFEQLLGGNPGEVYSCCS